MPIKDLTNQKFGRLTVVDLLPTRAKNGSKLWRCRCECGAWVPRVIGHHLTDGSTNSCGCLRSEKAAERKITHGLSGKVGNSHYSRWQNIKQRTSNANNHNYACYGARGIKMYPAWFNNFALFKAWLDENLGPCPEGYSLDRIDVDGCYCPNNLRWATAKQQINNRRI